jgi:cation diffusion facilitator family transporter
MSSAGSAIAIQRRKRNVALLSVGSNSCLVVGKLVVGLAIGSVSVLSEAIHSGVDLLAALIALFAVRSSGKPADREHPFGHGKWESLSGAIEALLIFLAAGWIIFEAVHRLLEPAPLEMAGWGVGVMALSAAVNWLVSARLFKVGRETESLALTADGWHLRTDVYTSLGVMLGLGIIWLGGRLLPGRDLTWLDPAVAICVAVLILHAAWKLTREALGELLDSSLPEAELAWILERLQARAPTVRSYHRLRTRRSGGVRFVDFHLVVAPDMRVEDAHRLSHEIADEFRAHFSASQVLAHVEPCDGRCPEACLQGCQCSDEARAEVRRLPP